MAIASIVPAIASPGTPIAIYGAGFGSTQGTSTLTIGGVAASALSWSDGQIIAPIPATASDGTVELTVNGEESGGAVTLVPSPMVPPNLPVGTLSQGYLTHRWNRRDGASYGGAVAPTSARVYAGVNSPIRGGQDAESEVAAESGLPRVRSGRA